MRILRHCYDSHAKIYTQSSIPLQYMSNTSNLKEKQNYRKNTLVSNYYVLKSTTIKINKKQLNHN